MKILVIAPHPDDEVLGCGGTIAKHVKNGDDVCLCIITKAYLPDWPEEFIANRPKEIEAASSILGIKETILLDFPTVKLDTIPQKELIDRISSVVMKIKPDILYVPHKGDLHKDHRLVFEASLVAARPGGSIKKILSYETLSETDFGQVLEPFVPTVYEDIAETFEIKIEAMNAYASEIKQTPHPRSIDLIEILAKKRGSESGLRFAESFVLIREVK